MSAMDVYASIKAGAYDKFDYCQEFIEWVADGVRQAEYPVEFHPGDGPIPKGYEEVGTQSEDARRFAEGLLGGGSAEDTDVEDGEVEKRVMPHFADQQQHWLDELARAKALVREAELITQAAQASL